MSFDNLAFIPNHISYLHKILRNVSTNARLEGGGFTHVRFFYLVVLAGGEDGNDDDDGDFILFLLFDL